MPTKTKNATSSGRSKTSGKQHDPRYTAKTADRHELYQMSVQNVEAEIDFVDATFEALRGRQAARLREDFAGTANSACEWVRRRESNTAVAVDLDAPTLEWGRVNNLTKLDEAGSSRVRLIEADVREPGPFGSDAEIVLAMNFSYWIFQTRDELRRYFETVRASLADDGLFFLDFYGGSEAMSETLDKRKINKHVTYHWDQHHYDPMSGEMECRIHFKFSDGSIMRDAFIYRWRLWTLPEIQELLLEAGFEDVAVYWEGTDPDDEEEGNGEFSPVIQGDADPAFICYIVAQKHKLAEIERQDRPS
ncbi:MAG: class I SAM-dependent methyltransferase [Planctomycetota bacterium]